MIEKIKLFSMFSGYGGAEFALQKANIDFETIGYSEIDKYAIQCYEQNHNGKNYGDATKINEKELPDFDLLTGGFPCQSFSVAGKGAGVCDSRGTLFWDIWRIAKEKKPKYMLLENVKGITNKTHKETFDKILLDLDTIGYQVDWKILNSKNYGIPQSRERVWFVCQRKDIAKPFEWPKERELTIFLNDILEKEVDEKYYLTEKNKKHLMRDFGSKGKDLTGEKISGTLTASAGTGGGNVPYLQIKNATKKWYAEAEAGDGISLEFPNSKTRRGRVQKKISAILQTGDNRGVVTEKLDIRKITPKEFFRLMGFFNDEINTENLSNTQKYKLAGNGWTISPASEILKNLIK